MTFSPLVCTHFAYPENLSLSLSRRTFFQPGAEIARFILASPIWKSSKKVGVYLAAPRLREVDTDLLVRAALGEENPSSPPSSSGSSNGGAATSASSKKRLFVPIVGDGPQEMRLVHLGELLFCSSSKSFLERKRERGICRFLSVCSVCCRSLPSLSLSLPDSLEGLKTVPPFGIREPSREYADGRPREDGMKFFCPPFFSIFFSSSLTLSSHPFFLFPFFSSLNKKQLSKSTSTRSSCPESPLTEKAGGSGEGWATTTRGRTARGGRRGLSGRALLSRAPLSERLWRARARARSSSASRSRSRCWRRR